MFFSLSCSFCCEKKEMLLCEWVVHKINAKTAVERRATAQWGSPDSVSDVDRVAVGAHKCHRSPKILLQPLHCMKGSAYKHKQGMKNGCLGSNWGAACSWADTVAWKKGVWRRKKKQDADKNGGRETTCVCVSGSNLCFLMSCFKRANSGTNATKSSPCVCRNMVLRKVCLASRQPGGAEADWTKRLPGRIDQSCSFVLPTLCVSSLGLLAKKTLQLLSWVILHVEKPCQGGIPLFPGFSNLWNLGHFFTIHTVPDGQQLCYYKSRTAVLIWVLSLEFRIATNFIGARPSLSQTAARAIGTSFVPALVSSLLPLDFCCLTFVKMS